MPRKNIDEDIIDDSDSALNADFVQRYPIGSTVYMPCDTGYFRTRIVFHNIRDRIVYVQWKDADGSLKQIALDEIDLAFLERFSQKKHVFFPRSSGDIQASGRVCRYDPENKYVFVDWIEDDGSSAERGVFITDFEYVQKYHKGSDIYFIDDENCLNRGFIAGFRIEDSTFKVLLDSARYAYVPADRIDMGMKMKEEKRDDFNKPYIEKKSRVDCKSQFESIFKSKKQFDLTKQIVKSGYFEAKNKELIDGKTFYLGKVYSDPDHPHTELFSVMFTDNGDGVLYPRILWKSHSGGSFRSSSYFITGFGGKFDKGKGIHYTQETKIVPSLVNYLELESPVQKKGCSQDLLYGYFSTDTIMEEPNIDVVTYSREVRKYDDQGALKDFQKYPPGSEGFGTKDDRLTPGKVKNFKYPPDFIPDFTDKRNFEHSYVYMHPVLGQTTVEIWKSKLNNRPIHIGMSYTDQNQVWIESIALADSKVNSYGIKSEVIDSGFLTHKPIEYSSQIIYLSNEYAHQITKEGFQKYYDITPFLANLKLIREFKKAKKMDYVEVDKAREQFRDRYA